MATSGQARIDEVVEEEVEAGQDEKWKRCSFLLIGNIPAKFRSADLRAVFSHYVEKGCFLCFHYRHRPEQIHSCSDPSTSRLDRETTPTTKVASSDIDSAHSTQSGSQLQEASVAKTKCCVVAMETSTRELGSGVKAFVRAYADKNWSTADGGLLRQRVRISELKVDFNIRHHPNSSSNLCKYVGLKYGVAVYQKNVEQRYLIVDIIKIVREIV